MVRISKSKYSLKKAQTATEYIVIVAVVIVIGIVVGMLISQGSGSASETSVRKDEAKVMTGTVAVTKHVVSNESAKVQVVNNNPYTISLTALTIDGTVCQTSDVPVTLRTGGTKLVTCSNINGMAGDRYSLEVIANYTNSEVSASYTKTLGKISGKVAGGSGSGSGGSLSAMTMSTNAALQLAGDDQSYTIDGVTIVMDLSVANE